MYPAVTGRSQPKPGLSVPTTSFGRCFLVSCDLGVCSGETARGWSHMLCLVAEWCFVTGASEYLDRGEWLGFGWSCGGRGVWKGFGRSRLGYTLIWAILVSFCLLFYGCRLSSVPVSIYKIARRQEEKSYLLSSHHLHIPHYYHTYLDSSIVFLKYLPCQIQLLLS